MSKLYLIPCTLAPEGTDHIPPVIVEALKNTRTFIVERTRTARRFMKSMIPDFPIDDCTFIELDKHDLNRSLTDVKTILKEKKNIGLLSEAGSPCIADPGARIVNIAREKGYTIHPLSGPSSILLGLISSGMNGQYFTFHGYLPIKDIPLKDKLSAMSKAAMRDNSAHIFIETPYRNQKMLEKIKTHVDQNLFLSISFNLTGSDQRIITRPISKWSVSDVDKSPAIFSIGKILN